MDPGVWKLVCDGYCKYSPFVQEQQWDAKEKCVMYNNLHNKDLQTIKDLTSIKENWERLELMDEREITSSNEENEKRKRKKKNPY